MPQAKPSQVVLPLTTTSKTYVAQLGTALILLSVPILVPSSVEALSALESQSPHLRWERCSSHQSCSDCTSSSWGCHWCSYDNQCHAIGSIKGGCTVGESCTSSDGDMDAKSCADHTNCAECSASSWGCHWCSFDEACHAIASVHGCTTGVNCYAIDRCQRLEPEKIPGGGLISLSSFRGVGPLTKVLVVIIAGLVLCCASLCFASVNLVKCAVDDLSVAGEVGSTHERNGDQTKDELEFPLLSPPTEEIKRDSGEEPKSTALLPPRKGQQIRLMYSACQICYVVTFFTTILLSIVTLSYAPRQPEYNVCTDQLAWKSIVEGITSLKMSAAFDLLVSVHNPNRFDIDLDNGSGTFQHDGDYVGSFTIPSSQIAAKAISDLVVKVTLTPDKWAALSLTSEYYQGILVFVIGGRTHVKIPALGNYQFEAKFDDIRVNVNDPSLDDTHLCSCPQWVKPGSASPKKQVMW